MMVDSYFEGQRVAALRCQESGLAMVNLYAKNVPAVFDIDPNYCDKLFLENSYFENVSGPAVVITNENNSNNQITFRNVYCKNVPTLAKYTRSNTATHVAHKIYKVKSYDHGLQMDNMVDMPEYETLVDIEPIQKMPVAQTSRSIGAVHAGCPTDGHPCTACNGNMGKSARIRCKGRWGNG